MTQQIAEYFKTQPVLKAWLFGSYSRGEQRADSDVDLLVKFDRSIPVGLFAYVRIHRELEEILGCKVDLVEEGNLRPAVQKTANRDLKVIYDMLDDNTVAAHFLELDEEGKVEIPEKVEIDGKTYTVTEIAANAFKDNKELTEVTIPGTVTTIGDGAFAGCENLRAIYVFAPEPISLTAAEARSLVTRAAENVPSQFEGIDFDACTLYVPIGSETKYREAEGWKLFTHIVGVEAPSGISTIRTEQNANKAVYNLSGQRLATPKKGLNIIGGEKVVIK